MLARVAALVGAMLAGAIAVACWAFVDWLDRIDARRR